MFERNGGALGFLWQVIPPARRPTADDGFGVVYGTDNATVEVLTAWARQLKQPVIARAQASIPPPTVYWAPVT